MTALDTWDKVLAAAEGGLLGENQWCELKEQMSPSNKQTNRELARDLASLSVYGGVLIYGVRDQDYEVVGCETESLPDRISQVAATGITPPLTPLVLDPIKGPGEKNLLVVAVAPSPLAPHMVDERYYGRSSNGKRVLSDPEVRDLMRNRDQRMQGFVERLLELALYDPINELVAGAPTGNGHAFFRAEPCTPVPFDGISANPLRHWLHNLRTGQDRGIGLLADCSVGGNDPEGVSLRNFAGNNDASPDYERNLASLSVHDGFTITAASGGATMKGSQEPGEPIRALTATMGIFAGQFLETVQKLSHAYGYQGEWRIGIHMINLRGATMLDSWIGSSSQAFPQDTVTHTLTVRPASWEDPDREIQETTMKLLTKY
ncbi:AlbA family DNA-binding domain-containing protein, partial [Brachybacterium sp. AOP25-B2-12]|uniref:AlbA family DNA-binding domain-containing protein n=1 Tax=Brachybacterium sp. AOP25-B2-12 TaxID=3457710 RepID=UPI004033DCA4